MQIGRRYILLGLAIGLPLFLYMQTLGFGFVLDDHRLVRQNPIIQAGLSNIKTIASSYYWQGTGNPINGIYRPLTMASYALNVDLLGPEAFGFHLVNLLLFIATAIILAQLLRQHLNLSFTATCIGVCIFIAHPIHSEIVSHIKSRDALLAGFFSLLAIWAITMPGRQNKNRFLGAYLSVAAACLSKESAYTLVAIIPLIGLATAHLSRITALKLGLALSSIPLMILGFKVSIMPPVPVDFTNPLLDPFINVTSVSGKLSLASAVLGKYIQLLVAPFHLVWDYAYNQFPIPSWQTPIVWFGILCTLAAGLITWYRRQQVDVWIAPTILLSFAIPVLYAILYGYSIGERLVYPSTLWLSIATAYLAHAALTQTNNTYRRASVALLSLWFLFYAGKTLHRTPAWASDMILVHTDMPKLERNAKAHYVYGTLLLHQIQPYGAGKNENLSLQVATSHLRKAIALYPDFPIAYFNLGLAEMALGQDRDALRNFKHALSPKSAFFLATLGKIQGILKQQKATGEADYYQGLINSYSYPKER